MLVVTQYSVYTVDMISKYSRHWTVNKVHGASTIESADKLLDRAIRDQHALVHENVGTTITLGLGEPLVLTEDSKEILRTSNVVKIRT